MKGFIRPLILAAAASLCAPSISALDLPTKTINNRDYYYYAVQRGDTLLGVAKKLGVTREDITKYNPSAADGLRQGSTLYLPVSEFASVDSPASAAPIKSKSTFAYKVKKGETLFGLSHRFGVKPDEIIALNPSANDGIKAGEILIIPGSDTEEVAVEVEETVPQTELVTTPAVTAQSTPAAKENSAANLPPENPAEIPTYVVDQTMRPVKYDPIPTNEMQQADTANIALLLPLMLDEETQNKNAKSATDFVRGFMLGLRQYSNSSQPAKVSVYDSRNSATEITSLMRKPKISDADIIIAPDDPASYAATVKGLGDSDAFLLNLFAVQDTTYLTDARIMQANVPHGLMYQKAAESLVSIYDGYTPVFIISKGGRTDKIAFTDYLRKQFADNDIQFLEIIYDGMMTQADLGDLDPDSKYVFIPASGALSEFNKFAKALITYRENLGNPSDVALFGYPDWTTFRGDALESLHRVGATIYSRFYADSNSGEVKGFESEFKEVYGTAPIEHVPSQAMLGYDTACYLMDNLRRNDGALDVDAPTTFRGLQSSFKFQAQDNVGPVNQVVYIVTFLPGEYVDVKIY